MKIVLQEIGIGYGVVEIFQEQVSALVRDELLGFAAQDEKIEIVGNPITDVRIKETGILLREPELTNAAQLIEKLLEL